MAWSVSICCLMPSRKCTVGFQSLLLIDCVTVVYCVNCPSPEKRMWAGVSSSQQRQKAVVKSNRLLAAFSLHKKSQKHSYPFRSQFDLLICYQPIYHFVCSLQLPGLINGFDFFYILSCLPSVPTLMGLQETKSTVATFKHFMSLQNYMLFCCSVLYKMLYDSTVKPK